MKVVLKIVGIIGITMAMMAMGNVSAADQSATVESGTTATTIQQIPIPVPGGGPIGPTNWGGGGGGSTGDPTPCGAC